ncbi:cupin domain-containing protein [candidate division KSB1 bacterium]|nr:cupin domain-containing protein [candidate division KSB1 bacterium]
MNRKTTMIKKKTDMQREPLPECHGGKGALDWTNVLENKDLKGRRLKFWHDNILEPGVSIGVHQHKDDEEYYYIIDGEGTMTLDDKTFTVQPGDITAVYPGGYHGLENTGSEPMRIIVVSVSDQ